MYQTYSKVPANAFAGMRLDNEEFIDIGNNLVIERGRFHMLNSDGGDTDFGKYMLCWKLVDGEWYIHFDVSQSDNA